MAANAQAIPAISEGVCHNIFVYDVAFSIDLVEAERKVKSVTQRETLPHKRRTPSYFEYQPAPLRIDQDRVEIQIGDRIAHGRIELVVYDFGAVSVIYRTPLTGPFSDLLLLSEQLYENDHLLRDSRRRVESLVETVRAALASERISGFVEDYVIFELRAFADGPCVGDMVTQHAAQLAQILRVERQELSLDEVTDALSHRISYSSNDLVLVDWNAAIVIGEETEDTLRVLEFANVELLEMRFLDRRLDQALSRAYERLSRRASRWLHFRSNPTDLRDISQWQMDSAVLFEGVNNVLKLVGDQYLARLYRLAAQRFHLSDWDSAILRKLNTLESIYQKISDQVVSRRMEVLEWIIIVLIAVSIVLPFLSIGRVH